MKKNHHKKRLVSVLLVVPMVLASLAALFVAANAEGTDKFQEPFLTSRTQVVQGQSNYLPGGNTYPWAVPNMQAVGFDSLYGSFKWSFVTYKGEIPLQMHKDDETLPWRYYNGNEINGKPRPYSDKTDVEIDDTSTDPHIWAMTQKPDPLAQLLGEIGFFFAAAINFVTSLVVDVVISLKNLDLANLLAVFDGGSGEFYRTMSTIFAVNPDTGAVSPIMVMALAGFLISLVSMGFKVVKGQVTLKPLLGELVVFIVAAIVAATVYLSNAPGDMATLGIDTITNIINELSVSGLGDTGEVFLYRSAENSTVDAAQTQKALCRKRTMEGMMEAQLGYPVHELDLNDGDFGDVSLVANALDSAFGTSDGINTMQLVTGDGVAAVNNLGYWLWAANSNVQIWNGNDGLRPFRTDNNGTVVNLDSNDRVLYVVDFLANLRELNVGNDAVTEKVDRIMRALTVPDFGAASAQFMVNAVQNVAMAYALLAVGIFCLLGQVVVTLGVFAVPVLPALMLFKGTRDTAKRMAWSFILSFVRFAVASAVFDVILTVCVLLSGQDLGAAVVSVLLCLLLARFCPQLMAQINDYITHSLGRNELSFVSRNFQRASQKGVMYGQRFNSRMDRGVKKFSDRLKAQSGHNHMNDKLDVEMAAANVEVAPSDKHVEAVADNEEQTHEKLDHEVQVENLDVDEQEKLGKHVVAENDAQVDKQRDKEHFDKVNDVKKVDQSKHEDESGDHMIRVDNDDVQIGVVGDAIVKMDQDDENMGHALAQQPEVEQEHHGVDPENNDMKLVEKKLEQQQKDEPDGKMGQKLDKKNHDGEQRVADKDVDEEQPLMDQGVAKSSMINPVKKAKMMDQPHEHVDNLKLDEQPVAAAVDQVKKPVNQRPIAEHEQKPDDVEPHVLEVEQGHAKPSMVNHAKNVKIDGIHDDKLDNVKQEQPVVKNVVKMERKHDDPKPHDVDKKHEMKQEKIAKVKKAQPLKKELKVKADGDEAKMEVIHDKLGDVEQKLPQINIEKNIVQNGEEKLDNVQNDIIFDVPDED